MKPAALHAVCLAAALLIAVPTRAQEEPPSASAQSEAATPPPRLVLRGFGNVNFEAAGNGAGSQFVLGELDVFFTAQLSEDLSALAEMAFEPQPHGHNVFVDLERYQIKWSPFDLLNLVAGRMHVWVGYWNHTYHHGTWFQVTAFRPLIYRFEDDGGILPLHEVGIQAMGTWARSSVSVLYSASLSNGRGPTSGEVQTLDDANRGKALNLWAAVKPTAVPGLELGGSLRFDRIPEDVDSARRRGEMEERIQSAFAIYDRGSLHILAELVRLEHREDATGATFVSRGFYVQSSVRLGQVRPYYRYDDLDHDERDPFYLSPEPSERKHTLGLRLDPWPWAGLMLEASHHEPRPGQSYGAATLQLAFTF